MVAVLFWFLHELDKTFTTKIRIPIVFDYNKEKYLATSALPENITFQISGQGWDILKHKIRSSQQLVYNLKRPLSLPFLLEENLVEKGKNELPGLEVIGCQTDTLYLKFDKVKKKTVRLFVDPRKLSLQADYEVKGEPKLEPNFVEFTGAGKAIETLPDALPVTIDEKKISEDLDITVKLKFENFPQSPLLNFQPLKARLKLKVRPALEQLLTVPVFYLNGNNHGWRKSEVQVSFLVSNDMKDRVKPTDFEIVANLDKINLETNEVKVRIQKAPDWVSDLKLEQESIILTRK